MGHVTLLHYVNSNIMGIESENDAETTEAGDFGIVEDGFNTFDILCERCKSVILKSKTGKHVKKKVSL